MCTKTEPKYPITVTNLKLETKLVVAFLQQVHLRKLFNVFGHYSKYKCIQVLANALGHYINLQVIDALKRCKSTSTLKKLINALGRCKSASTLKVDISKLRN